MRYLQIAMSMALLASGTILVPAPAGAQQFICSIQCQTPKGDRKGSIKTLPVANGYACINAGKKAVKEQCADTGIVRFGACFGRIVNGKIAASRMDSC